MSAIAARQPRRALGRERVERRGRRAATRRRRRARRPTCRASRRSATSGCRSRRGRRPTSLIPTTIANVCHDEQVLVERRNRLVEADPERQPPRGGDQDRVGERACQDAGAARSAASCDRTPDRAAHDVDDPLLLLRGDPGPERHGEVLARELLGLGQRALLVAEVAAAPAGGAAAAGSTSRSRSRASRSAATIRSRSDERQTKRW